MENLVEKIKFSFEERLVAVSLCREIDHHAARSIREEIDKMLFSHRPAVLVLDFSLVEFMDSSGLGLIIGRSEMCRSIGASVELRGLSDRILRLVKLGGVMKIDNVSIKREGKYI